MVTPRPRFAGSRIAWSSRGFPAVMHTQGITVQSEDPQVTARIVFNSIASELRMVELEFERQARSNIQVIAYLGDYLRGSGGKRVRPALTILSNYAAGGDGTSESVIRMAGVMEFLHTATLVHDDIIDNAETRRSRPSINSRFGNQTAVLMGDWLYMSAFEASLAERSLPILDILTNVTRKMTEGELLQLSLAGCVDITEDQYFDILQRKTAFLFSACSEIGAMLAGASDDEHQALREYGMHLGTAFQLTDDVLDFTASGETLGKASGADLLEGKLTLPLILLLRRDPSMKPALVTVMRDGNYDSCPRAALHRAVERCGALGQARRRAAESAEAASRALDSLPASKYTDALRAIAGYIVERDR